MPVARIVAGEWLPDLGELNNPGLVQIFGVHPTADGYKRMPVMVSNRADAAFEAIDIETIDGFHIHSAEDSAINAGTYRFFAGDDDDLYHGQADNSYLMELATAAASAFAPTAASGWQFLSFGNVVIATDYASHIQYTGPAAGGAANYTMDFENYVDYTTTITSYRPKARYLASIKGSVLLGHIQFDGTAMPSGSALVANTQYPSLVMWSAPDNYRRFGDPAATPSVELAGSDYQLLADEYGAITGLVGGDYAYIFKERAIYRMDGPPYTFRPVVLGTGTIYCNSIVKYYDDVYFWSDGGPMVLRYGSSVPEKIGGGRVQRTLLNANGPTMNNAYVGTTLDAGTPYFMENFLNRINRLVGFADYRNGYIVWVSTTKDASTVSPNDSWHCKCLIYHIDTQKFGFFSTIGSPIFHPKSMSSYQYTPPTPDFIPPLGSQSSLLSVSYGIDFNGTYFITGAPLIGGSQDTTIARFAEDVVLDPGESERQTRIQDMVFSWGFLTFPLGQGNESQNFQASKINRIRLLYMGKPLKATVNIKSTSRFPIDPEFYSTAIYTSEVEYDPYSTTYQEENGWITMDTTSHTHHKITLQFENSENDPSDVYNDSAYAFNMVTVEIDYTLDAAEGGAKLG